MQNDQQVKTDENEVLIEHFRAESKSGLHLIHCIYAAGTTETVDTDQEGEQKCNGTGSV